MKLSVALYGGQQPLRSTNDEPEEVKAKKKRPEV